jgi:ribosomal protein S18 acetylase RimI-like enzyme
VEDDAEFEPALCFTLTETATSALAGFAQCWSSGFVKDIGVRPDLRRHGLGRALMAEIFRTFQARGIGEIRLKVHADNPSGAPAFYRALGMTEV